jgi:hypothetical protein
VYYILRLERVARHFPCRPIGQPELHQPWTDRSDPADRPDSRWPTGAPPAR